MRRSPGLNPRCFSISSITSPANARKVAIVVRCSSGGGCASATWRSNAARQGLHSWAGPADVGFTSRYVRTLRQLAASASASTTTTEERIALARAHVALEVLRAHVLRSLCARTDGRAPGHEGSIDKLLATRVEQRLHHVSLVLRRGAIT